jgi:hypothetical protein
MAKRTYGSILPALALCLFSLCGLSQETDISTRLAGTIDEIMQDDGYIVINGNKYAFREPEVVITYNDQEIRSVFLAAGQRVFYRTRGDGSISVITLVPPNRELDQLNAQ